MNDMKKILGAVVGLSAVIGLASGCATKSYEWRDWHCNQKKCDDKQKEKWCANMCDHIVQTASECSKFQDPAEETCKQYVKPAEAAPPPADKPAE
jgi:hypothetical protein